MAPCTQGSAFFLPLIQVLMLKAHLEINAGEQIPQMVAGTLAKRGVSFKVGGREIHNQEERVEHIKKLHDSFSQTLAELNRLGAFIDPSKNKSALKLQVSLL